MLSDARITGTERRRRSSPADGAQADALHDLARRVSRLAPSHRDPERFFIERDEIRSALHRMAREM
jgi:hypothetical protein